MPEKTEVNVMTNLGHEISKAMEDAGLVYDLKMQQKVRFVLQIYTIWTHFSYQNVSLHQNFESSKKVQDMNVEEFIRFVADKRKEKYTQLYDQRKQELISKYCKAATERTKPTSWNYV